MNGLKKQDYPIWIQLILILLRGWLYIYDWIAYLPFKFFANPERKMERSNRIRAKPIKENDPSSPWRSVDCPNFELITEEFEGCNTLDKLFDRAVEQYAERDCLGTREILSVEQEKQPNGKLFEKYDMGDYQWITYEEVNNQALEVGSGLLQLKHKVNDKIVLFAETRQEWMITAMACIRYKFPLVTVYATLGEDAIAHAINETEATTIFTSQELVKKAMKILPHCKSLKRVIYFESRLPDAEPLDEKQFSGGFSITSFNDLTDLGGENVQEPSERPKPTDLAVVMYTSGTTGLPKGVLITHRNLVAACAGTTSKIPSLKPGGVYIAYLPLAHIYELACELGCFTHGVQLGYSSALTLVDNASKIKRGAKGDATVLKPTLMATVPAIMDRLFKAVIDKVDRSPPIMRALFEFLYELKRSKLDAGYDTPFLNRLVFNHIHAVLGGRIGQMMSGGAPLNAETQKFMNICFCCPIAQGYGLTETCAAATICDVEDLNTGSVGAPLPCNDIMLREWKEGGYSPSNKPYPQGEILISGASVAEGYLNNPKKTDEDFVLIDKRRWFCTGDIGQFLPNGSLKIIDRKKDLLKLAHGEYISLNRVESCLLTCPLIDNLCIYGNSDSAYVIALVIPNRKNLENLGQKVGVNSKDFEVLRTNKDVTKTFLQEIQEHSRAHKLEKFEIPEKVYLCKEIWSTENGLLTDAMKLKRKPIEKFYDEVLKKMFEKN